MESFERKRTIPMGYRFDPTDRELIHCYLYTKNNGEPLPSNNVIECDVYGDGELWREIFEKTGEKTHYFYTKLKKKSEKGSRVERGTGCCTWKSQKDIPIHIGENSETRIGSVRSFTLIPKKGFKARGRWVMHEYRLDGDLLNETKCNDYVICKIKKKKELPATPANKLTGNSNHTKPMESVDMDTTKNITQMKGQTCNHIATAGITTAHSGLVKDADINMQELMEGQTCNNIATTGTTIAHSGLVKDADINMQELSEMQTLTCKYYQILNEFDVIDLSSGLFTPPQHWQPQTTSSTSAPNLAETHEHMGIKFADQQVQGADSELILQQQQQPLPMDGSVVNNSDGIMELSSSSDSDLWSIENLEAIVSSEQYTSMLTQI